MESMQRFKIEHLTFKEDYEKEIAGQVLEYLKETPNAWPVGNGIQYP